MTAHAPRYLLLVAGRYRATCSCHWMEQVRDHGVLPERPDQRRATA